MVSQVNVLLRPAREQDRHSLANMLHFETFIHRHLDWRPPLDWLGHHPYLVLEEDGQLSAALACPPDPPGVGWIRLFVTTSRRAPEDAWNALWPLAREELADIPDSCAAAIPLQKWFREILEQSGFKHIHNVVVLSWSNGREARARHDSVEVRLMTEKDLPGVQQVDEAAFGRIWRNSLESLYIAYEQAVYATVVEKKDSVVAYQISTPSPVGAHLARLAVHPSVQEEGVGRALVRDLQGQFLGPGPRRISVNTQDNNKASLALYKKTGFVPTNEGYPVYQFIPSP